MRYLQHILLFIIASVLTSTHLIAQDESTFYTDSTGQLFVNPKTPVHLYLSTSPDGKDAVRLKSQQPEGEPMYWDGHGPHYLTHLNLYLGRKIRFDLYADGRPPKTSTSFDAKKGFQQDNTIYISGIATVEFMAHDANSGVALIHHSVNGSSFTAYNKPLVFDKEGEYLLKFYAIDNVGNKEDEGERTIVVDTSPPTTELITNEPKHNNVVAATTRFELIANDKNGIKDTYFLIDENNPIPYKAPISISKLTEGEHTITWYSIDKVGNKEDNKTHSFYMDKTPPMVFEEIMGNTYMVAGREFSSGRSQLRIIAVDNKAGVKEIHYSINNQPFKLYEKPIYLSELSGAVTVKSYAIDNVNNKGISDTEGQQFSMPEVDITGPKITFNLSGPRLTLRDTLWVSPKTLVSISATDNGSGLNRIEYKVNESSPKQYTEKFSLKNNGSYTISATAWDNVENLNIGKLNLSVDDNAPEIFHHFSVKPHSVVMENGERIAVFSKGVTLYLSATDDIVGTEKLLVSVNGSSQKAYNKPLTAFKANQSHTVTVAAIDGLGNSSEVIIKFRVE
ncbi:MAG TPA: hypothetical protein PLV65_01765 [Tenuifilaceae bacterium]|nr:hypothetical protein [Tenuifilaceae bacterium]